MIKQYRMESPLKEFLRSILEEIKKDMDKNNSLDIEMIKKLEEEFILAYPDLRSY